MRKQILERGYVTLALTDIKGNIYNTESNPPDYNNLKIPYYLSEVYCESSFMTIIIRKGILLVNPTKEKLQELYKQSIINCNN